VLAAGSAIPQVPLDSLTLIVCQLFSEQGLDCGGVTDSGAIGHDLDDSEVKKLLYQN
jgi:hypothetical protein